MGNDGYVFFLPMFSCKIVGIENGDLNLTKLWSFQTNKTSKSHAVKGIYQEVIIRITHRI